MRLGVGLLTYERPIFLQRTLESLWPRLAATGLPMTAVLVDNGSSAASLQQVASLAAAVGAQVIYQPAPLPPSEDLLERDKRIAAGFFVLAEALLSTNCTHALLCEDDWDCVRPLPLATLAAVLDASPHLGQVRLRACAYDDSLTGCSTRHFITRAPIVFGSEQSLDTGAVAEAEMHWTNNPSLVRRDALSLLARGFRSELEMMSGFHRRYARNAQLRPGSFVHTGPVRRRSDLEAIGVFGSPRGVTPRVK
jgi:hypothetical protein